MEKETIKTNNRVKNRKNMFLWTLTPQKFNVRLIALMITTANSESGEQPRNSEADSVIPDKSWLHVYLCPIHPPIEI